ncbi:MAG: hypothetical protein DCC55_13815 [Chloroflexi bacterium]|nr:MAG: hypothetical protein DCC55_13815 [Chloroflexota bacterium]
MILLYAVFAGLIAGWLRAWYHQGHLVLPELHLLWLVPLAFAPQWLAFFWPPTRELINMRMAAVILVGSQVLLLIFAWANRKHRAFWWLGLGLLLNLLVIVLNGGLMPVSPETLSRLFTNTNPEEWQVGQRVGTSKDIVLPEHATRLAWLSDRFLLPEWMPQRAAFSLGDVLIAVGAFWFLWQAGAVRQGALSSARSV